MMDGHSDALRFITIVQLYKPAHVKHTRHVTAKYIPYEQITRTRKARVYIVGTSTSAVNQPQSSKNDVLPPHRPEPWVACTYID